METSIQHDDGNHEQRLFALRRQLLNKLHHIQHDSDKTF